MSLIRSVPSRNYAGKAGSVKHLIVSDMTTLTQAQCKSLKCGDVIIKEDVSGQHAYIVSYKKEDTGMCITYTDASCVETVSYDLVEGVWTYNSKDVADLTKIPTA